MSNSGRSFHFTAIRQGDGRVRRVVLIAVASAVVFAGCGGTSEQAGPGTTVAVASSASLATTPPATATSTSAAATTTTVAPTTTTDPTEGDKQLVRSLYYGFSQSWRDGLDAGFGFMAAHEDPLYRYTASECKAKWLVDPSGKPVDGSAITQYSDSIVPDVSTMALDPHWVIPAGHSAGQRPEGRTYIVTVTESFTENGSGVPQKTSQLHVTILNGEAYFYYQCDA
jgi:hypothetical protein